MSITLTPLSVSIVLAAFLRVAVGGDAPRTLAKQDHSKTVNSSHPDDAKSFGGHWYEIINRKTSWHDAKRACETMGGHLACIESRREQAFVAKLAAGKYYYLGATDQNRESKWCWINGSKFDYQHWYEGQPNNYGGDEHYLATYDDGEWVDVAAEGEGFWMPIGFICEWDR